MSIILQSVEKLCNVADMLTAVSAVLFPFWQLIELVEGLRYACHREWLDTSQFPLRQPMDLIFLESLSRSASSLA